MTTPSSEEWRDVVGYEGLYEVSSLGRVRSMSRYRPSKGGCSVPVPERILKLVTHSSGYLVVTLSKDSIASVIKVHRLVAIAFLPNPDNLPQVNHKDERKINNRVDNLEWCTSQYNADYSKAKKWLFKNPEGVVTLIRNLNQFCISNDLNQGCMWSVHEGKSKQHKGWTAALKQFDWKFFTNLQCEYFPCHSDVPLDEFNCMECFCSLYFVKCPGNYTRLGDGRKDCMACTLNHEPVFWEIVQSMMKNPKRDEWPTQEDSKR